MSTLTGFDSEADRRDAIRRQIVDTCLLLMREHIDKNAVTQTKEELDYLEMRIITTLLIANGHRLLHLMLRQEIDTALQEIEGE